MNANLTDIPVTEHTGAIMEQATVSSYNSEQMNLDESKYLRLLDQTADPVMITNVRGTIEYVNPAFEKMSGYSSNAAVGRSPDFLKSGKHPEDFYQRLWNTVLAGKPFIERFINRREDGSLYYEQKTISPIKDTNGRITHFVSTSRDMSTTDIYEKELLYLAHHDPLTGLPNRILFQDRLTQAIIHTNRNSGKLALLFIDLDRFKIVNDTLGHNLGDALLVRIAKRFTENLRLTDTIARLGGDEFAIILENIVDSGAILTIVSKILSTFDEPFMIEGHELLVSASLGIAIYPDDGDDVNILIKNSDTAMYLAKDFGGHGYQFYSKKMSIATENRLRLETSMRKAIEKGEEFILHYQPQINLETGEIVCLEALVRWKHPALGMVSPGEFIPLAEETGLIIPLSELILRLACIQTRIWNRRGNTTVRTAVNISGRLFKRANFHEQFLSVLDSENVPSHLLEIEITESSLLGNDNHIVTTLEALRDNGITIAIDDFGTGYSSLGYLKRLPIDIVKIDRTFVRDIAVDADDASIVQAITTMAHKLGLKAVAEGVETREQLDFLRSCQCDIAQGFYLGRPMNTADISNYLQVFGMQSRTAQLKTLAQQH